MSKAPANASPPPPHRSWPNAVSTAATNVSPVPTTVIWFGVTGSRCRADISASAWRRTHASNRVVNIDHLSGPGSLSHGAAPARFLVDSPHPRGALLPALGASFLTPLPAL